MRADTSVFRPGGFIEGAIDNLTLAVSSPPACWPSCSPASCSCGAPCHRVVTIPLAVIAAALVLDLLGETLNAISLADSPSRSPSSSTTRPSAPAPSGGACARAARARSRPTSRTPRRGSAAPLAYATLAVLLAIVPVSVMKGRPGAFFEPLALSYVLAVVAAMVVALTVTPALAALLFSRGAAGGRSRRR